MKLLMDQELAQVHTAMPGTIVAYDPATQTATVRPGFKRVYGLDESVVAYKDLLKVPVVQLQAGSSWVRMPVTAGDRVLLIFAERSLDVWAANGGEADPLDCRKFHISDAIAIPGLNPVAQAIQAKGAATSLEIQNGGLWAEFTAAGKFKVTNAAGNELVAVLNAVSADIKALMVDVQTAVCASPGSPLVMASFPTDLATLVADLVKLQSFT